MDALLQHREKKDQRRGKGGIAIFAVLADSGMGRGRNISKQRKNLDFSSILGLWLNPPIPTLFPNCNQAVEALIPEAVCR
jgi:hypothetical protein